MLRTSLQNFVWSNIRYLKRSLYATMKNKHMGSTGQPRMIKGTIVLWADAEDRIKDCMMLLRRCMNSDGSSGELTDGERNSAGSHRVGP